MPTSPVSLYIDLEPDETAELEGVARASLDFAAGIREAAFLFDPSFQFRIELVRGDQSSLWLKARLRWIRGVGQAHPTMSAITLYAAGWFSGQTLEYGYTHLLDHLLKSKDPEIVRLEPAQIEEIAQRTARIATAEGPQKHFRGVLRNLEPDRAIRGVGVSTTNDAKPDYVIPKAEFGNRLLLPMPAEQTGAIRTRNVSGDYVIIRPVLKEGGGRWRLRGEQGEFSATIADDNFYNDILRGTAPVPLASEIHMKADVEIREMKIDAGAWKPIDFRIVRVHSITRQPGQTPLPLAGEGD